MNIKNKAKPTNVTVSHELFLKKKLVKIPNSFMWATIMSQEKLLKSWQGVCGKDKILPVY